MRNNLLLLALLVTAGCADHLGHFAPSSGTGDDAGLDTDSAVSLMAPGNGHPGADVDAAAADDADGGTSNVTLDGAVADAPDGSAQQDAGVVGQGQAGADAAMPATGNACGGTATKFACEAGFDSCTLGKACFSNRLPFNVCPPGCTLANTSSTLWVCGSNGDTLDCPACKCQ